MLWSGRLAEKYIDVFSHRSQIDVIVEPEAIFSVNDLWVFINASQYGGSERFRESWI